MATHSSRFKFYSLSNPSQKNASFFMIPAKSYASHLIDEPIPKPVAVVLIDLTCL